MRIEEHGGLLVQFIDADGPPTISREDTSDLIGNAWVQSVSVIAVPIGRLDPAFLDLRSGVAGELTQKFVNYGLKLAVLGDVSVVAAESQAFADYVRETNRGDHIWFYADEAALAARLAGRSAD